jgi:hypothetical protein
MTTAANSWTVTLNNTTIPGTLIVDSIILRNYSKSFIVHDFYGTDYENLFKKWTCYIDNERERLENIMKMLAINYTPTTDNTKTRTLTETMENTSNTETNRIDNSDTTTSNTTTYGRQTSDSVSTYDQNTKLEQTTTNSGSDTNSGTSSNDFTSDLTTDKTDNGERLVSETINGANSTVDNMKKYIELNMNHDMLDIILTGFEKRYLFYGGDFYDY